MSADRLADARVGRGDVVTAPAVYDPRVELAPIEAAIVNHPRSLQVEIGPSEIGTPCVRRLGHLLAGTPRQPQPPAWRPTVGTAVHAWIADGFKAANERQLSDEDIDDPRDVRYLVERRVTVGTIDGRPLTGSCDLYDRETFRVSDWKIVGPSSLKKYRTSCRLPDNTAERPAFYADLNNGPGQTYRVQAHCYGLGLATAGEPVREVAIWMLPSNGELADAVRWAEPWRPDVAEWFLGRANQVAAAVREYGAATVLPVLARVDDRCGRFCPFYRAGADPSDPSACPGSDAFQAAMADRGRRSVASQLAGLIPPDDLGAFGD